MPTYNRSDLLRESMDSVLGQDYANLELLVVDDGSADDTPALLAAYASRYPEERFRFLRQENAGQARALNRGNKLARGELIGYLCDDDLLMPGAVSRQTRELVADPAAAVAYSGYQVIDEVGAVQDTVRPIEYSPVEALRLHDTVIGPGGLVRRSALESSGGWPTSMRWMADLVLWMGVGLAGRAIRVDEPLVSWRRHTGSVTVRVGAEHAREHLTAFQRGLSLNGLPELPRAVRAEALRNACVFAALFGGGSESWPEDRFAVLDLHRKRISAWASGYGPGAKFSWTEAEAGARLFRELAAIAVELAEVRAPRAADRAVGESGSAAADDGAAGGVEVALRRLHAIGALPGEDGSFADGVGEDEMRLGLLEAAVACGSESDPRSTRFLILDRRRVPMAEGDLDRLVRLGFASKAKMLRAEIEPRRRELERLRGGTRAEVRAG